MHQASIDVSSILKEVAVSLDDGPHAHVVGNSRIMSKLYVINTKLGSEQTMNDPFKMYEQDRSQSFYSSCLNLNFPIFLYLKEQ